MGGTRGGTAGAESRAVRSRASPVLDENLPDYEGLRLVHQGEGSGRVRQRLPGRNSRARANPASVRATRSAARTVTKPTLIKASRAAPWHSSAAQLPPAKAMRRSSSACSSFHQLVTHPPTDLLPLNPFASPPSPGKGASQVAAQAKPPAGPGRGKVGLHGNPSLNGPPTVGLQAAAPDRQRC